MAYISINGFDLPPCKRGVKPTVTTVVNAGRNANAVVVGQRVGRDQFKIDQLEWAWLDAHTWGHILSALAPFFVMVTFIDPVSNRPTTKKMYPGDRTAEPYWVDDNGHPLYYRNCRVNLVDCGE